MMSSATPPAPPSSPQDVFNRQLALSLALRSSTAKDRIAKIKRLRDCVLKHKEEWYEAAWKDFRKPPAEVDIAEILPVCIEANTAIRHLKYWLRPKGVWPNLLTVGTSSRVQHVPRGRCLIVGPFNYPVNLTLSPLVSAIAAGNTVIVKPSELTPNLSAVIAKVIAEVFPPEVGEVALFEGDAALASTLLEVS